MILSKKHNFLYIGIYKTATTSIHDALLRVLQPIQRRGTATYLKPKQLHSDRDLDAIILHKTMGERHMPVKQVKELYFDRTDEDEMKIWDGLYIWSFVRNPWDLTYSHFKMMKRRVDGITKVIGDNKEALEKMPERLKQYANKEFKDWVKQHIDDFMLPRKHSDQYSYLCDNDNNIMVDDIYRFETIRKTFPEITQKIGLSELELPMKNAIRPNEIYQRVYDEESKNMVAKRFERDIDFFKYSF